MTDMGVSLGPFIAVPLGYLAFIAVLFLAPGWVDGAAAWAAGVDVHLLWGAWFATLAAPLALIAWHVRSNARVA